MSTATLQRIGGEGGKSLTEEEALDQTRTLVRVVDAMGITDPDKWQSALTKLTKVQMANPGFVKSSDIWTELKNSGQWRESWNEEFATTKLPILGTLMGTTQAAKSLKTMYNAFIGGHETKSAKEEKMRLGLMDQSGKLVDEALLGADPIEWADKYLRAAVSAMAAKAARELPREVAEAEVAVQKAEVEATELHQVQAGRAASIPKSTKRQAAMHVLPTR